MKRAEACIIRKIEICAGFWFLLNFAECLRLAILRPQCVVCIGAQSFLTKFKTNIATPVRSNTEVASVPIHRFISFVCTYRSVRNNFSRKICWSFLLAGETKWEKNSHWLLQRSGQFAWPVRMFFSSAEFVHLRSIQLFLPLLRQWISNKPRQPASRCCIGLFFWHSQVWLQTCVLFEAYFVTIGLPVLQFFGNNKTTWSQHKVVRMKMQVCACKFCGVHRTTSMCS